MESMVFNSAMTRGNTVAARQKLSLVQILLLVLLLAPPLVFPVSAEVSPSEEGSSARVLPPEERNFTGPCMGEAAFHRTWFDRTHSYLTVILCQPSIWFDGFFGQHRAGEDWAGSLVRWQGAYRVDEKDGASFRSEFRASVRLPKLDNKMKLVVTSESRDDQTNSLPDDDPFDLEAPPTPGAAEDRQTTAGLRYYLTDTRKVRLSTGAGFKLGNPVQPYVRFRLRYTEPLGNSTLLRLTPTAIWLKDEGINRSLRVDLEQRIGENILVRASQSLVRKELEPGILWGSVLILYNRLTTKTVLALEGGVTGTTYPSNRVERYRLATHLRSNFLRDWLFLELEPEYYWPRDTLGEYHLFRAITFRLEMQFYS